MWWRRSILPMSPRCMKGCRPVSAGVDDPKHGFSEAALAAVMAAFDTHPEAGSKSPHARRRALARACEV